MQLNQRLSDGVMVAQGPLEAFVMVRIHVGQPTSQGQRAQTSEIASAPGLVLNRGSAR